MAGNLAASYDRHQLEKSGMPKLVENSGKLKSDYSALEGFAQSHKNSEKAEVTAAINRLDAYSANNNYYSNEIQKNASALRRGNHAAIQNMGMGLVVGGTRLVQGVIGDYLVDYHKHARGKPTLFTSGPFKGQVKALGASESGVNTARLSNEWLYASAVVYCTGVSVAIVDSWRIRLTGELQYQRQKNDHTLPGQVIRARLAQLDQVEAKI
jgi:hypothetical protein